jgi:hypothetical protein
MSVAFISRTKGTAGAEFFELPSGNPKQRGVKKIGALPGKDYIACHLLALIVTVLSAIMSPSSFRYIPGIGESPSFNI